MIVALAASPAVDRSYRVQSLRLGKIHRSFELVVTPGGKGLNLLRAAHALGAEVAAVAVLGGATGAWIEAELVGTGLRLETVSTVVTTRSCLTLADDTSADLTEVYEDATTLSPTQEHDVMAALVRVLSAVPATPGWLAVAGSWPGSIAALRDVVQRAHDHRWRVAVDTSGAALQAALDLGVALVNVNRVEAQAAVGGHDDEPAVELARRVCDRSGGLVVLTDGARGSVAVGPGAASGLAASVPVRGRYPVGSGDCFLAGLLTVLDAAQTNRAETSARPVDVAAALAVATGAAAANAEVLGAAVFDPARARILGEQVEVVPVVESAGRPVH